MDSSDDRTEDGCSSQKSDSMDRSNGEKTCPHFLLSQTISFLSLPPYPMFSLFPSLSLSLFFFLPLIFAILARRTAHLSCRIWYVRVNSSIEDITQGHPLKSDKRPSRKSNAKHLSNAGKLSHHFLTSEFS